MTEADHRTIPEHEWAGLGELESSRLLVRIAALEAALQRYPADPRVRLRLAMELRQSDPERQADEDRAATLYRGLITDFPEDPWVVLGSINGMKEIEANEAADWVLRAGKFIGKEHDAYPWLLNLEGTFSMWSQDDEDAGLRFRRAIELDPENPIFWESILELHVRTGRAEAAHRALDAAHDEGLLPDKTWVDEHHLRLHRLAESIAQEQASAD